MVNIAIYLGKSSQSFQHKIYTLCIYVFICQLHWVFLAAQRIFSSCRGRGGQGSWIGLFFLRLTGSREQAQQLWPMDLAALQYVCAVCPGRGSNQHPLSQQEILNYWTTREGQDAGLGVGGGGGKSFGHLDKKTNYKVKNQISSTPFKAILFICQMKQDIVRH